MGSPGSQWARQRRLTISVAIGLTVGLTSLSAQADSTNGWIYLGGGVLVDKHGDVDSYGQDIDPRLTSMMQIDAGLGAEATGPVIFGGLLRVQPVFEHGVDLALLGRVATTGFQSSTIGVAFDVGVYQRWWGYESTGFMGEAVLGGPLGLQLSAMGTVGTSSTWGFGTTLGIDLARLTVHRDHLLDWWPNPKPSDSLSAATTTF